MFNVDLPDIEYFQRNIRCQHACPVGTDANGYVRAIADGNFELAYLIARAANPLASICGRVCRAPCEMACRRREIDQPVSIRALKRFASDHYLAASNGFDPLELLKRVIDSAPLRSCRGGEELSALLDALRNKELRPPTGENVAVIGSGPAGLAAAHDLAVMGFRVTVYETESLPGGMLALGIPEFRLPRNLIQSEIEVIRALGVEFICNTRVGKDITLPEIRKQYRATVITVGANRLRSLTIPGHDGVGVLGGLDLLRAVSVGQPLALGRRVVVIGGGNVAIDVSRTALRMPSVREVHLCYRRSLEEMPAEDLEIVEGHEEGVKLWNNLAPVEILLDESRNVRGITFKRVLAMSDDQGQLTPTFDDQDVTTLEADTVIWAIGQQADLSFGPHEETGIQLTDQGTIAFDPATQATSLPDTFVAGDAAHGPGYLIEAVASGKRVARSIYRCLHGRDISPSTSGRCTRLSHYKRDSHYEKLDRLPIPTRDARQRKAAQNIEVEKGYTVRQARREATRCLDCSVNTIFDSARCVLCGGCVDVCPESCLRIVSVSRLQAQGEAGAALDAFRGDDSPDELSAILKDETKCIRCSLCADRCPAGAITMERFSYERRWHERQTDRTAV